MRFIFILALLITAPRCVFADNTKYHFNSGIALQSLNLPGTKERIGFLLGAGVELPLLANFSLLTGISFEQKGGKADSTLAKFDYMEIPLLLKMQMSSRANQFFLFGGASYGVATHQIWDVGGTETSAWGILNKNSLSLPVGFGMGFAANDTTMLNLSLMYSLGMTNLADTKIPGLEGTSVKTRGIYFVVGVQFDTEKRTDFIEERAQEYLYHRRELQNPSAGTSESSTAGEESPQAAAAEPVLMEEQVTEPIAEPSADPSLEEMPDPASELDIVDAPN
jgi:hypothetical protein